MIASSTNNNSITNFLQDLTVATYSVESNAVSSIFWVHSCNDRYSIRDGVKLLRLKAQVPFSSVLLCLQRK